MRASSPSSRAMDERCAWMSRSYSMPSLVNSAAVTSAVCSAVRLAARCRAASAAPRRAASAASSTPTTRASSPSSRARPRSAAAFAAAASSGEMSSLAPSTPAPMMDEDSEESERISPPAAEPILPRSKWVSELVSE